MNIQQIYKQYKITSMLQLHQLRSAAVAQQICDNLMVKVDKQAVITACLLHDMGNVIKFKFHYPAEFFEPEGVEYWKVVQAEYFDKYKTTDEHPVTLAIAKELGVSHKAYEYIGAVGFTQAADNAASKDYGRKICAYADMRVGPHAIISLEERLQETADRYLSQKLKLGERNDDFAIYLRQIEEDIFAHCRIKPDDITIESSAPIVEQLKSYEIQANSL